MKIMSQEQDQNKQQEEQVWSLVERSSKVKEDSSDKEAIRQVYGDVADLYHLYRPRYPESLIDEAIQYTPLLSSFSLSQQQQRCEIASTISAPTILEIGCGPGTMTLSLAKRGFQVTAIDPGMKMIEKAKEICRDFPNVEFHNVSLKEFMDNNEYNNKSKKYHAIVAASSLHWALAESNYDEMIQKLHNLLYTDGNNINGDHDGVGDVGSRLLLFWNFPPEPNDTIVMDQLADALEKPKPFYFGNGSQLDHERRLAEKVLSPLTESKLFSPFVNKEVVLEEITTPKDYVGYLQTLSNYIILEPPEKKQHFFETTEAILRARFGDRMDTTRKSLLNISKPTCKGNMNE